MSKRVGPTIIKMNKEMTQPDGVVIQTRTCSVHVLVEDGVPGETQRVSVEVASRARPDDKQVSFRLVDAGKEGFAQIFAQENAEAPPKREPDPDGEKISGDLQGKYAVLVQKDYPGSLAARVIKCTGGFGCQADGHSRKLFGKYVRTGEDFFGRRESVWRFATTAEVTVARAKVKS